MGVSNHPPPPPDRLKHILLSSIQKPGIKIRKLVDNLQQAEITIKLEKTENLKLQNVNKNQTNSQHIRNIQHSKNFSRKNYSNTKNK